MTFVFDANAHPTVSGQWSDENRVATFESLAKSLSENENLGACAVGLWNIGSYEHAKFLEESQKYKSLVPIAAFAPSQSRDIEEEIGTLATLGYHGIKIHPASCGTRLEEHRAEISKTLQACTANGLICMICTNFSGKLAALPDSDPYWTLIAILKTAPDCRVVLIHAGVTRLMEFAELARFNPNLLLDLSYTIMKYRGSSLETDLHYLFQHLDQRLCLGSDFPEYTIGEVRKQALQIAEGIPQHKIDRIFFKNIMNFLELDDE